MITWQGILVGVGIYMAFEGAFFAFGPESVRSQAILVSQLPSEILRWLGIFVVSVGLLLAWFAAVIFI